MILSISISNYRSIKDTVTLSMLPVKGHKELQNNIALFNKTQALRSAVIYGANASGKSNVLNALVKSIKYIQDSTENKLESIISIYDPFLLDTNNIEQPFEFEIEFLVSEVRYIYSFSCSQTQVQSESLVFYPKGQSVKLFKRNDVTKFSYGTRLKGDKKSIEKRLLENQLFLTKAANENIAILKEVYEYFSKIETDFNIINGSFEIYSPGAIIGSILQEESKEYFIKFKKIILALDVGIEGLKIRKSRGKNLFESVLPSSMEEISTVFDNIQFSKEVPDLEYELFTIHSAYNRKTGVVQPKEFSLEKESAGTRNLFPLAIQLLNAFESGSVMIIDEFEKSLHPQIVRKLVQIFHDPDINVNNAQLIFSTHAVNLLDNELFRRDQIWMTEKDEYGVTDLYSLSEVEGVRKDIPYDKWYLSGRFGATPIISEPDIEF